MLRNLLLSSVAAFALVLAGCGGGVDLNEYDEGNLGGSKNLTGTEIETVDAGSLTSRGGPSAEVSRVIYFDFDSYVVKDEFRSVLNANAQYLRENRSAQVTLEGHTDARGSTEYNLALGQKRAEAVRQALLLSGVSDMQIEAVSYGKERPKAYGADEEAWSQNRRVEFSYR